ncbi:MAG: bifunctional DNA-formamidopyrimidine glycosylase/DNA-(apurinic or apyrimidinic site) lyase [Rhodospirillaceae bacterium]
MPELPEVETVCRGLAGVLEGHRLTRVQVRRKDLRIPFPPRLAEILTGRRVEKIRRRAKYILMDLDDGQVLIAHLGMSGRMTLDNKGAPLGKHDHVVFTTDEGTEVRFNDPRRFGLMTLVKGEELESHKLFRHLGPDPLTRAFTPALLSAKLQGRKTSIKAALLDQRIVVGVGNIYACESLYRAGISPLRKAGTVAGARAERLVPAIKAVLKQAIAAGGSSLRDHVQPSGELGYFQDAWKVYGREGESCACLGRTAAAATGRNQGKGVVRRITQGGRSTFYCAGCQT